MVSTSPPALLYTLPRHATLEYEFYDDRLVCYDRWLEDPVWNLPPDDVSARLAHLREYDDVADRLERAVRVEIR